MITNEYYLVVTAAMATVARAGMPLEQLTTWQT